MGTTLYVSPLVTVMFQGIRYDHEPYALSWPLSH